MAWLHENREEFRNAVLYTAEIYKLNPVVVEKDYYVTLILKSLKNQLPFIVFKGGTSLSKCYKVIKRFSEDIDVTIDTKLSQGQMGKVKNAIKVVANELDMSIPNINETRSRRSYNKYFLAYETVLEDLDKELQPAVILETSFAEISFPTVILPVHSYLGDMLQKEEPKMVDDFGLATFEMKVQGLDRTLVDKVFAICDYHLKNDVRRHSRHIYDIYKLLLVVPQTEEFKELIREVRSVRAKTNICPSSQPGVDIPKLLTYLVENGIYKEDYNSITSRLLEENVSYETAIGAVEILTKSGVFEE